MNLIPKGVTRNIGRKVLLAKKHSPHIFFTAGVIGAVGSTVLACRATLKLDDALDGIKSDLDAIKTVHDHGDFEGKVSTEADRRKALVQVSAKSVIIVGKLYGPAIVVGGVSIACLAGSHIQLTRRNTALTATLALVSKAYDEYRIRVQDSIGTERELEIYRNIQKQEVEVEGKKKVVKVVNSTGFSPYARFFDKSSPYWQKDPELNRMFLTHQQNYANHQLHARGHVFLNEVYDDLGMERSQAGQVVGWVVNSKDGDGFIDFGIFETSTRGRDTCIESVVLLDFNVDGVVYDKICEPFFDTNNLVDMATMKQLREGK